MGTNRSRYCPAQGPAPPGNSYVNNWSSHVHRPGISRKPPHGNDVKYCRRSQLLYGIFPVYNMSYGVWAVVQIYYFAFLLRWEISMFITGTYIMVIELSGVQFGLKSNAWLQIVITSLISVQALIKYFSSWQQASQTKNFLPIFFIKMNFGCNSNWQAVVALPVHDTNIYVMIVVFML
jgi:hypothetical protein